MPESSRPEQHVLEAALGHVFADSGLLDRALTHSSAGADDVRSNERLEFLGDRVLGLLVAEMLFELYPDAPEGPLSRRHDRLVRKSTLAEIAKSLDLGGYLKLARGESASGGRHKAGILADAMEAVIAAIYLDGGLDAARRFIIEHWRSRAEALEKAPRDPKTALQEWAQARGLGLPVYDALQTTGPSHAPTFEIAVEVEGYGREIASGRSKQAAEKAAAQKLLDTLGVA